MWSAGRAIHDFRLSLPFCVVRQQVLVVSYRPLEIVPIGRPETSARNCHYSLRNSPEERSSVGQINFCAWVNIAFNCTDCDGADSCQNCCGHLLCQIAFKTHWRYRKYEKTLQALCWHYAGTLLALCWHYAGTHCYVNCRFHCAPSHDTCARSVPLFGGLTYRITQIGHKYGWYRYREKHISSGSKVWLYRDDFHELALLWRIFVRNVPNFMEIRLLYPLRTRWGTYLRCCSQGGRSS